MRNSAKMDKAISSVDRAVTWATKCTESHPRPKSTHGMKYVTVNRGNEIEFKMLS
jgi:hypothetical protein